MPSSASHEAVDLQSAGELLIADFINIQSQRAIVRTFAEYGGMWAVDQFLTDDSTEELYRNVEEVPQIVADAIVRGSLLAAQLKANARHAQAEASRITHEAHEHLKQLWLKPVHVTALHPNRTPIYAIGYDRRSGVYGTKKVLGEATGKLTAIYPEDNWLRLDVKGWRSMRYGHYVVDVLDRETLSPQVKLEFLD